jgi:hypothetical protein
MTVILLLLRAGHAFSFGSMQLHGRPFLFYASGWAIYFLAVGLYEEFTFRGYPQFTLTTGMGFWPAALLLSALFGAGHLANPGENLLGVFQVFLTGLLFCFSLWRTGDLWFAVGLHGAWDWAETFFYGVPNSGLSGPGHFLNPTFHGPKWLTGGSAGPEGSTVTLLVEIAMIGLVMLRFRRSSKTMAAADPSNDPEFASAPPLAGFEGWVFSRALPKIRIRHLGLGGIPLNPDPPNPAEGRAPEKSKPVPRRTDLK